MADGAGLGYTGWVVLWKTIGWLHMVKGVGKGYATRSYGSDGLAS